MSVRSRVALGICGIVLTALLMLWAVAVYHVNALVPEASSKVLEMGERADLGVNYFDSTYDLAPGYKLAVEKARIMTAREYLIGAGVSSSDIKGEEMTESSGADVLVVTLVIANEGTASAEDGTSEVGVSLSRYTIVGADKSKDYQLDEELLGLAYPELAGDTAFALKPGSTYEMDVPFFLSGSPAYLETYDRQHRDPIEGNEFAMLIANSPERIFLKFAAER